MMSRKGVVMTAGMFFLTTSSFPAAAAEQWCTGNLFSSWTNRFGDVLIESSWRNEHNQICNIRYEWKGIPVDTCIAWVAKLDAAVTMNKQIVIYYNEAPSCNSLPTYEKSPSPYYIMLKAG